MAHYEKIHNWNLSPREAVELQKELRARVRIEALRGAVRTVAGADISFNKYSSTIYAGVVVLELPSLRVIAEAGVESETRFPYVPGLLSFRESPAVLEAWEKLGVEPDVVFFDGQGLAHPRRVGIASHAGLFLNRPTIGCAKSVLVGKYEEPASERGNWSPMIDRGEVVGAAVRTKNNVAPVFISPGHLIDLPSAIELTLACDGGYRIPEPTRRAHQLVNKLRKQTMDTADAEMKAEDEEFKLS